LRKDFNRSPLLVACDVYRPAAVDQLKTLGKQLDMPVFSKGTEANPVDIAEEAIAHAKEEHHDYVIIDTAGRLHVDEELMDELAQIKETVQTDEIFLVVDAMTGQERSHLAAPFPLFAPDEIFLVVDAMTGQDAVNVAENFNDQL